MRGSLFRLSFLTLSVLLLDLWTKQLATQHLQHRPPVEILGEYVRLTYTRNSGVAFGLGAGVPFPYAVFSIIAVAIILYLFVTRRAGSRRRQTALALIMGGAIGNLIDRLRTGEVVDFIEVGFSRWHWPVFNVADSAVSVGVVLFALTWSWHEHDQTQAAPSGGTPPDTGARGPDDAGGAGRLTVIPGGAETNDSHGSVLGARTEHGRAAGPLPGDRADRPVA